MCMLRPESVDGVDVGGAQQDEVLLVEGVTKRIPLQHAGGELVRQRERADPGAHKTSSMGESLKTTPVPISKEVTASSRALISVVRDGH